MYNDVQTMMQPAAEDIFRGIGVEVALSHPDDFRKVRETLTRMGQREGDDTLVQTCYILHRRGRYVIAHQKELEWLDGRPVTVSEDDIALRNLITSLLHEWKLLSIDEEDVGPVAPMSALKIIAHRDKDRWNLIPRYDIGGVRRRVVASQPIY